MYNNILFDTPNYSYMYSFAHSEYVVLYPILKYMIERGENEESISIHSLLEASALKEYSETDILYYWKKYNYLKDNQFIGKKSLSYYKFYSIKQ